MAAPRSEQNNLADSPGLLSAHCTPSHLSPRPAVLQAFVPPEEVAKVMSRALWDEERWAADTPRDTSLTGAARGSLLESRL